MPPLGMSDNANAAKLTSHLGDCFKLDVIVMETEPTVPPHHRLLAASAPVRYILTSTTGS